MARASALAAVAATGGREGQLPWVRGIMTPGGPPCRLLFSAMQIVSNRFANAFRWYITIACEEDQWRVTNTGAPSPHIPAQLLGHLADLRRSAEIGVKLARRCSPHWREEAIDRRGSTNRGQAESIRLIRAVPPPARWRRAHGRGAARVDSQGCHASSAPPATPASGE